MRNLLDSNLEPAHNAVTTLKLELVSDGTGRATAALGRSRASVLAWRLLAADCLSALVATTAIFAATDLGAVGVASLALGAAAIWPMLAFALGLYRADDIRSWASGLAAVPRLIVLATIFSWPLLGLVSLAGAANAALFAGLASVSTLVGSVFGRAVARAVLHGDKSLRQRTLIVGSGLVAEKLTAKLEAHEQFGLVPVGLVDEELHDAGAGSLLPYLGNFDDLPAILQDARVDRVIIAFTRASHEQLLHCVRACRDEGVAVDIVPRLFDFLDGVSSLEYVGGLPVMSLGVPRLSRTSQVAKRTLDIVASATLIVMLFPLLITIALAIKLESRGPVLFRQARVGRGGKIFYVLKFRSMISDAEHRKHEFAAHNDLTDGVMFKIRLDPRITRAGQFLRRSSLDELPQILNVLTGDMSLVGPRPIIPQEAAALTDSWQARRLELRPGMTGPWQTSGRSHNTFEEMLRLDYQYVAGWSLARDFEILLATLPAVVTARGAF